MTPEKILYETAVTAFGGRDGKAQSADGSVVVDLSVPKGLGGPGGEGTNPEQLFAAGYAACFLGAVKLVAQKDGPVLGVHIVGDRVGELIAEAQLIYNWEALPGEVAQLIHPHPTQSEAIGEAHLLLAGKPPHVHD